MPAGLARLVVAGAAMAVVGGTLAVGTLLAQPPAQGAANPAYPVDSIYGTWSETPDCSLEAGMLTITPQLFLESEARRMSHSLVTIAAVPDGVMVTLVRQVVARNGAWEPETGENIIGTRIVMRRDGNALRGVRIIRRDGREEIPPDPVLYACS